MKFLVKGAYITNIKLNHQLTTGLPQQSNYQAPQPQSNEFEPPQIETDYRPVKETFYTTQTPRPVYYVPPETEIVTQRFEPQKPYHFDKKPTKHEDSINSLEDEDICGVVVSAATSLIKGGTKYKKGDWPWLAALFYKNGFICGGTISKKLYSVLTTSVLAAFRIFQFPKR